MPGPVSDTYDPEWGTASNADSIGLAIEELYERVSDILLDEPPVYILDLVGQKEERSEITAATLTEWEWRIIRFALERAGESL